MGDKRWTHVGVVGQDGDGGIYLASTEANLVWSNG